MSRSNSVIVLADYKDERHARDIASLLDAYACDPMGGGKPLDADVKTNVVSALSGLPHAFSVIAYVDGEPAGLINCFELFSTFACKPLVNIHDIIVLNEYRGQGLSQRMLKSVEDIAVAKGCCKLTLEVLSCNAAARASYEKFGFSGYELDPQAGSALFWQKTLHSTR